MEVHQHTHTPRKKWTHYFREFPMLFHPRFAVSRLIELIIKEYYLK
ncbi:MAG: hypothetical protein ACO25B_12520 [Chitinophagaceae bacterium]